MSAHVIYHDTGSIPPRPNPYSNSQRQNQPRSPYPSRHPSTAPKLTFPSPAPHQKYNPYYQPPNKYSLGVPSADDSNHAKEEKPRSWYPDSSIPNVEEIYLASMMPEEKEKSKQERPALKVVTSRPGVDTQPVRSVVVAPSVQSAAIPGPGEQQRPQQERSVVREREEVEVNNGRHDSGEEVCVLLIL